MFVVFHQELTQDPLVQPTTVLVDIQNDRIDVLDEYPLRYVGENIIVFLQQVINTRVFPQGGYHLIHQAKFINLVLTCKS